MFEHRSLNIDLRTSIFERGTLALVAGGAALGSLRYTSFAGHRGLPSVVGVYDVRARSKSPPCLAKTARQGRAPSSSPLRH